MSDHHHGRQVIAIIVAVVLTFALTANAVTVILGHTYTKDVSALRHRLYTECVTRAVYDMNSQATRRDFRAYYARYVTAESSNRFIDDALRRQRITDAGLLIASLDRTLATSPKADCSSLR